MPEHDETDAPEVPEETTVGVKRLTKPERWDVQDKRIADAETK